MCPKIVLALKIQIISKVHRDKTNYCGSSDWNNVYNYCPCPWKKSYLNFRHLAPKNYDDWDFWVELNVSCKSAVKLCDIIAWFCEQQSCFQVCNFLEVKMHLFAFGPPCDLVACNLFSELSHVLFTFIYCLLSWITVKEKNKLR